MIDPSIFKVLFGLAAGLTAWVSVIFVSRRFATERAALAIRDVTTDAHGDVSLTIENIGSRPALAIHMLIDGRQVGYLDGLAAGDRRPVRIENWKDEVTIRVVFVDASRHRRAFKRQFEGGEAPRLIEPGLPSASKRVAQWLHLMENS